MSLRPATLDDAELDARLDTALYPDEPKDPAMTRHWWSTDDPAWTTERWVVRARDRDIGTAYMHHAPWEKMPERFARVGAHVFPDLRTVERLGALTELMEDRARRDGASVFVTGAREDDGFRQRFLDSRGYREERRMKSWELDLSTHREQLREMLEHSRQRMRDQNILVRTLEQEHDPQKLEKLFRMTLEAESDVPTTVPHVDYPFEIFRKWIEESPGLRPDRIWIAREGDDLVGISMLAYPPNIGNVWTDWTGTARRIRGKGVARALKLETVAQAISLGVMRVRTSNDGENAPILHLNEEMGYERIPGWIQYHRSAGS
ncbi:MAG: hypothetical protein AUH85_02595 [Chloroflexi bacterium 13_1_40CM_4_68_4]|nr:MAG: hypothetical protein AUH85_02595 [Chloroflexi bacterium 13_1_40CM_4_68_4]